VVASVPVTVYVVVEGGCAVTLAPKPLLGVSPVVGVHAKESGTEEEAVSVVDAVEQMVTGGVTVIGLATVLNVVCKLPGPPRFTI